MTCRLQFEQPCHWKFIDARNVCVLLTVFERGIHAFDRRKASHHVLGKVWNNPAGADRNEMRGVNWQTAMVNQMASSSLMAHPARGRNGEVGETRSCGSVKLGGHIP